jgi:hypothetical protein
MSVLLGIVTSLGQPIWQLCRVGNDVVQGEYRSYPTRCPLHGVAEFRVKCLILNLIG